MYPDEEIDEEDQQQNLNTWQPVPTQRCSVTAVEIINNGQLEIRLYNKGRNPSVRLRATNYNTWINAEMWLHGSCADITEGICGNWNGNAADDLAPTYNINAMGENFKEYDENCPAPPRPWDPCEDIGPNARAEALELCAPMKGICHFVKFVTMYNYLNT